MPQTEQKPEWIVVADPIGENPGFKPEAKTRTRKAKEGEDKNAKNHDNVGGVVIYTAIRKKDGRLRKEEVARVGYIRPTSENPKDPFDSKLDEIIGIAQKTCDVLNTLNPDGELL